MRRYNTQLPDTIENAPFINHLDKAIYEWRQSQGSFFEKCIEKKNELKDAFSSVKASIYDNRNSRSITAEAESHSDFIRADVAHLNAASLYALAVE